MRARMSSMAALILVFAGCGATIHSTTAANADLAKYRTYSFFTPQNEPAKPQTVADQTIESSLRQSLAAKGLTEAAAGQSPDFLVAHQVKLQQRVDVTPGYYGYGYGYGMYRYGGGFGDITQYTEGTLIVDFIDPHTNQVFWRGTANDVVNHPEAPNQDKISKVVGQVVEKYPGMMAATPRTTM